MSKSAITSKGQTTVPKEVRERLGVGSRDTLEWEVEGNAARVTAATRRFLARRRTIAVGRGSAVEDVRRARAQRGRDAE